MGRKIVGVTVLVLVLGATQACVANIPDNIVDNWDFSGESTDWKINSIGTGNFIAEKVNEYDGYQDVFHLKRTNSDDVRGATYVSQEFSTLPEDCVADSMKISIRFKIVSHSLSNSGDSAQYNGGYGDYPLHLFIHSGGTPGSDMANVVWNKGLLTVENTEALTNYLDVAEDQWVEDSITVDLAGYSLTGLTIAARGWDWDVYIDYIKVEPMPGTWP